MAKNEFFPFAIGAGANVLTPAEWSALPMRSQGFASGAAKSQELNTAWRQSSVISSVVAQFIADSSSKDVLDNGDTAALLSALKGLLTPTGIPLAWPTAIAPTGWLKCNGAAFDKTRYPNLALAYPSGVLPDLRGEFIRGWDDSRGVDVGRALLTMQGDAIRNITGEQNLVVAYNGKSTGSFYNNGKNSNEGVYADGATINDGPPLGNISNGGSTGERIYFDASRVVPVASENRPRNVAFNYIVRAA